jgi:long-chain acyl-CoA synthetase
MNLADTLVATARAHGQKLAIRLDELTLSYAQLDVLSRQVASLLAEHGVGAGDRIAIMLPNVHHFAAFYYGALRAGAVVVPMNPLLKDREVSYYLRDSGAKMIFVWHDFAAEAVAAAAQVGVDAIQIDRTGFLDRLRALAPRDGVVGRKPDDTAVILYTSGTTGQPKGAELTHANLAFNVDVTVRTLLHLDSSDVIFGGLPLFHVFGQTSALNAAVSTGATLTLLPRFDPAKVLEVLVRDRVTVFQGVPTMYSAILNQPAAASLDVSALRVCVSGGSAMPVEVLQKFENRFGCMVLEGYGLSETTSAACFNHRDRARAPGAVGTPIFGVQMRVADDRGKPVADGGIGEILVRGPNVMKGYWNKPDKTAEAIDDGWLRTGDVGRMDDQGNYFIVDRKKDMIIRGGYNVYPREIEEVFYEHADVAEAAVIGMPHPELGEEIGAAVALKPGATASPADLRDFVKARVAAYKYPRHVRIVKALPKGATGKILKREINLTLE